MAIYYKPQSPIQSGEDFIYPITTADQIMKSDKTRRLEQAGLIVADNSTSLGGVAAKDYALKTDTAPDSAKLGGKAPEYYTNPRNLLDNSDFRNPVNQRGVSSVTTTEYAIDRWFLEHAGDGISISDDGVTFNATNSLIVFLQKINKEIRNVLIGKTITVAATDSSGNVGISTCVVPNFGEGVDSAQNNIGDTSLKVNIYTPPTDDTLSIRLLTDSILSPVTIVNIALYEGSYTADTLPPYVPKGYAAELAACNSAPISLGGGYGGGSLQAYPVGSIYISVNSTSPASLFGGTWERIAQGRMLLGMGAIEENHNTYWGTVSPGEVNPEYAGEMGGEAWHKLTINELPAHTHTATAYAISSGNYTANAAKLVYKDNTTTGWISEGLSWISSTGGDQHHSNMPPYLAVYMWKRVS